MADIARSRGISTALGYAMSMGVTVLLVTGLITAAGGFATDERSRTISGESEVIGKRIATNLMTADRLAREADSGTVRVHTELPETLAGKSYTIRIVANASQSTIVLRTENPDVSVSTPFQNRTRVNSTTLSGGPLVIRYEGTELEVKADD